MRLCNKKDDNWLTALMLDADAFGGCSEDGVERHKMKTYVRNMLSRPDLVVLTPAPGKMIHTFHRKNGVMHEIHTAIRLGCDIPGKERVRLTRETCEWMIKHRGARKFITHVPAGNRAAGIYAVACGLVRVGVLTSAIKKDGILVDMALYQSRDEDIQEVVRSMSCR
jgi:hypothetical protein